MSISESLFQFGTISDYSFMTPIFAQHLVGKSACPFDDKQSFRRMPVGRQENECGRDSGGTVRAIVTGAASGIGLALVEELSRRGHFVHATDIDEHSLRCTAERLGWREPSVLIRRHDVRDAESWSGIVGEAAGQEGGLDLLINVAGVIRPEYVHELSPANVALQLDVNTKGMILGTRAAADVMIPKQQGHIVNLGSMASLAPVPGLSVYSASKFAIRGFTLAVAQELRQHHIAVTLVCPDAVDTPMVDYQVDFSAASLTFSGSRILKADEVVRMIIDHVLVKKPVEVAFPWDRALVARLSAHLPKRLLDWLFRGLASKGLQKQKTMMSERTTTRS